MASRCLMGSGSARFLDRRRFAWRRPCLARFMPAPAVLTACDWHHGVISAGLIRRRVDPGSGRCQWQLFRHVVYVGSGRQERAGISVPCRARAAPGRAAARMRSMTNGITSQPGLSRRTIRSDSASASVRSGACLDGNRSSRSVYCRTCFASLPSVAVMRCGRQYGIVLRQVADQAASIRAIRRAPVCGGHCPAGPLRKWFRNFLATDLSPGGNQ